METDFFTITKYTLTKNGSVLLIIPHDLQLRFHFKRAQPISSILFANVNRYYRTLIDCFKDDTYTHWKQAILLL
jgi:hypothetical protein